MLEVSIAPVNPNRVNRYVKNGGECFEEHESEKAFMIYLIAKDAITD